jgi:hypothetical protein
MRVGNEANDPNFQKHFLNTKINILGLGLDTILLLIFLLKENPAKQIKVFIFQKMEW